MSGTMALVTGGSRGIRRAIVRAGRGASDRAASITGQTLVIDAGMPA